MLQPAQLLFLVWVYQINTEFEIFNNFLLNSLY